MGSIADNITGLTSALQDSGVRLLAVSKFHPASAVMQAYDAGQREFGESRADELHNKALSLPDDIVWHFIGHLQTNKVRKVVAHAHVIQSVDSERLALLIDSEAHRISRPVDLLLQVHVAAEQTKTGFTPSELLDAALRLHAGLRATRITGIMGMATNTDDNQRVAADFRAIRQLFDTLKQTVFAECPEFATVSMGMSDDRDIAIAAGTTMIRVGTDIFGPREY